MDNFDWPNYLWVIYMTESWNRNCVVRECQLCPAKMFFVLRPSHKGGEPQRGGLQQSSSIFKVKWPRLRLYCTQNVTKYRYIHGLYHQVRWWLSVRRLPVQGNQRNSMDTWAIMDTWQASEISLRKSRPVKFWLQFCGN